MGGPTDWGKFHSQGLNGVNTHKTNIRGQELGACNARELRSVTRIEASVGGGEGKAMFWHLKGNFGEMSINRLCVF